MTASSHKNETQALSFGIMLPGDTLQRWQAESISMLLKAGARCRLLIVDDNPAKAKTLREKLGGYLNKHGLYRLYLRLFFRPQAKQEIPVVSVVGNSPEVIRCKTEKKGFSEYFEEQDIQKIRNKNLDFILRFGFNIIRGDILQSARYGVWSFHHDDEQKYRGGPPGFWEIMHNDPVSGAILQRLTERLDGGVILKKALFQTVKHSYEGQIDNLYFSTASMPLMVYRDIVNGQAAYLHNPPSRTRATIYKAPSNFQMLKFGWKIFKNKLQFHYEELFKPEVWNVAIREKSGQTKWLPHPEKGRFYADPFAFADDKGKLHLFFEDYHYRSRRGVISHVSYSEGRLGDISTALEEPFHLSYPFLFSYKNNLYCLPESTEKQQIRLYQYHPEKEIFTFKKVLLDDFAGADPTLFEYQNKWWLFVTEKRFSNTHLHIFYADNPLGEFRPHKQNPVKIDITNARPGGTPFVENGILYRPAQNSAETYGQNVVINKVIKLSENEFEEIPHQMVFPEKSSRFNKGLHTFSQVNDFTIFDGKYFRFNRWNFWYQLKRKSGRLTDKEK